MTGSRFRHEFRDRLGGYCVLVTDTDSGLIREAWAPTLPDAHSVARGVEMAMEQELRLCREAVEAQTGEVV